MDFKKLMKLRLVRPALIATLLVAMAAGLCGCGGGDKKKKITGTKGVVEKVVNGNTVVLANGLRVKLCGVMASDEGKRFLENNVQGQRVTLIADSQDPVQSYKVGSHSTVKAYLVVEGKDELNSVNGRMVRIGLAKRDVAVIDSVFERQGPALVELTSAELLAKLNPATFSIIAMDGSGQQILGTGFYISSKGVAVTNAHVLSAQNWRSARIIAFTHDGKYDANNYRTVSRVLFSGSSDQIATDFTIFEVNMNGFESAYVPIAAQKELDGNQVFKLGCQLGEPAHLANGLISRTTDGTITHSININHGDSGSPLVNVYGQVIGINQGGRAEGPMGGATSVNYAVDIQTIRQWLEAHPDSKEGVLYGR